MELYHGTCHSHLNDILTNGLLPRHNRRGNWFQEGQADSHPDMVYMTSERIHAEFHSLNSSLANNDSEYCVLTIDYNVLDETNLYPDENYFMSVDNIISSSELKECQSLIEKKRKQWYDCLQRRQTLCHKGHVPIQNIIGYYKKPLKENIWHNLLCFENETHEEFTKKFWAYLNNKKIISNYVVESGKILFDLKLIHIKGTNRYEIRT